MTDQPMTIRLNRGQAAIVDAEDYHALSRHKWHCRFRSHTRYAARTAPINSGKPSLIMMHRVILNAPPGLYVDHINGNGLDNRKCNLRLVSDAINHMNRHRRKPTRLGLPMGVSRHHRRFQATIRILGRSVNLGLFSTPEEAHEVYAKAREQKLAAALADIGVSA